MYEFNRKSESKDETEREREADRHSLCVYSMCEYACVHTLPTTHRLCAYVRSCGVLHFIRTRRDGRSDRFRALTHKSAHLHWVSKKQQHKALIVLEKIKCRMEGIKD